MIVSTVLAATLAAAQPQAAPVDHSKMDHGTMDHGKMDYKATPPKNVKAMAGMDCCKDGRACCAKDKAKPAA